MERNLPAPTMRFFWGETGVFVPTLAKKFVGTIRQVAPCEGRDRIDYSSQFRFRFLDSRECVLQRFFALQQALFDLFARNYFLFQLFIRFRKPCSSFHHPLL